MNNIRAILTIIFMRLASFTCYDLITQDPDSRIPLINRMICHNPNLLADSKMDVNGLSVSMINGKWQIYISRNHSLHNISYWVNGVIDCSGSMKETPKLDDSTLSRISISGVGFECPDHLEAVNQLGFCIMTGDIFTLVDNIHVFHSYNLYDLDAYDCTNCMIQERNTSIYTLNANGDHDFCFFHGCDSNSECYCKFNPSKYVLNLRLGDNLHPIDCYGEMPYTQCKPKINKDIGMIDQNPNKHNKDCRIKIRADDIHINFTSAICIFSMVDICTRVACNHKLGPIHKGSFIIKDSSLTDDYQIAFHFDDRDSITYELSLPMVVNPCDLIECSWCLEWIFNFSCHNIAYTVSLIFFILLTFIMITSITIAVCTHIKNKRVVNPLVADDAELQSLRVINTNTEDFESESDGNDVAIQPSIVDIEYHNMKCLEEDNYRDYIDINKFLESPGEALAEVSLDINESGQPEQLSRRRKNSSRLLNSVMILSLFFSIPGQCLGCSQVNVIVLEQERCAQSKANLDIVCDIDDIIEATFPSIGYELCLIIKSNDNNSVQMLNIIVKGVDYICQDEIEYFAIQPSLTCHYQMSCYHAGTCVGIDCEIRKKMGFKKSKTVKPFFSSQSELILTDCDRVSGGLLNGCFFSVDGCGYKNVIYSKNDRIIYTVSRCTSWKASVLITLKR